MGPHGKVCFSGRLILNTTDFDARGVGLNASNYILVYQIFNRHAKASSGCILGWLILNILEVFPGWAGLNTSSCISG